MNIFKEAFGEPDLKSESSTIGMSCTPDEKDFLQQKAEKLGLNTSELIRTLVLRGIRDLRQEQIDRLTIKEE